MSANLLVFSLVCSSYPQKDLGPPVSEFFWGSISFTSLPSTCPSTSLSLLSNSLGFHMFSAFSRDGVGVSVSLFHFGVNLEGERGPQTRGPILNFRLVLNGIMSLSST